MKKYRVEIETLSYIDVEANSKEEARQKAPDSLHTEIGNMTVFYEPIDKEKSKVYIND